MSKQIALVEDDQALRDNYVSALTKQGYAVKAYSNRRQAETAFAQQTTRLSDC